MLGVVTLLLPAAWLIDTGQIGFLALGAFLGMLGPAMMFGPQASFFAELFGGLSVACNANQSIKH
jgi:hypothetical protein